MDAWKSELLRRLPAVEDVLQQPALQRLEGEFAHHLMADAVRHIIDEARRMILQTPASPPSPSAGVDARDGGGFESLALAEQAVHRLRLQARPRLRRLINATGVILHTNLGRSVLAEEALQALQVVAGSYSNLEYDVAGGERGKRYAHVRGLLRRLSGAEEALAVNNNAAAVMLCLQALARNRRVIVSRGELVEIGGAFRIPDIMALSGCILHEIGTTNKTRLADYERAIGVETALLLKVHQSNFRIVGFTEEAPVAALAELSRRHDLPLLVDLGSGSFLSLPHGKEPTVPEVVQAGADLVSFSGDKLLGGPQAGIIVGRRRLVEVIERHPLTRALRVDKFTIAALEATLRLYLDPERARQRIPTQRFLALTQAELEPAAKELCARMRSLLNDRFKLQIIDEFSTPGGGSLPTFELPTKAVALRAADLSAAAIERHLRSCEPPVIVRIQQDVVLFDVRTLLPNDLPDILQACAGLAALPPSAS